MPLLPLCHQPSTASLQPPLSSKQSLLQPNHCALPLASHCCYPPLPLHTCWLLFFVIVVSAVVAPLPRTVHRVSSAAVVLHLICIVLHLILPLSLVCRCTCCALVDCWLLLVAAPLLPLCHHSCCLSLVIICHVICRGGALCTKTNMQVGWLQGYFFYPASR